MVDNKRVLQVVFKALDKVNQLFPEGQKISKSIDTVIFGEPSLIDSLSRIMLIVEIEKNIGDEFGIRISIINETELTQEQSLLTTIGSFVDYICSLLSKEE